MKYNIKLETHGTDMYDTTTGVVNTASKSKLEREAEVLKTISRLNAMPYVNLSAEDAGKMLENAERLHNEKK